MRRTGFALAAEMAHFLAGPVDQVFNSSEKAVRGAFAKLNGGMAMPIPLLLKHSRNPRSRMTFCMNRFRKLGNVDYHAAEGPPFDHHVLLNG